MLSFHIDYKCISTELCDIGSKYDSEKSSKRFYISRKRPFHPYSIFYHSLFKNHRKKCLNIAEFGIMKGEALLTWEEYFPNSTVFGFDDSNDNLNNFRREYKNNRIVLSEIEYPFKSLGSCYDIFIDNFTNTIEDKKNVLKNVVAFLKPGGIFVFENIDKLSNELVYEEELKDILHEHFDLWYFVSMENNRKYDKDRDKDKLFVLIKKGTPIFDNKKKMTLITPSTRPENLLRIHTSINFDYIDNWLIVYDGKVIKNNPMLFEDKNTKIKEYVFEGDGWCGNPQRNFALSQIKDENTYLYYLDDDNEIHPDLYKLLNIIDDGYLCTFNQKLFNESKEFRLGNNISLGKIDSAQFLIHFSLCKFVPWLTKLYESDGMYVETIYSINPNNWVYINNTLSYINYITNVPSNYNKNKHDSEEIGEPGNTKL
jgi:SAM-dependent methyltransferase